MTEGHYGAYLAEGQVAQPEWQVFVQGQECMPLEKCKNELRCKIVALWLKNKIDLYLTESQGGCARLRARVHKQNKGLLHKGVWAAQIELQ